MRSDVFAKIWHCIATNSFRYLTRFFLSLSITSARVSPSTHSRRMHQWSRSFITSSTLATGSPVSAARASFMASFRMSDTL